MSTLWRCDGVYVNQVFGTPQPEEVCNFFLIGDVHCDEDYMVLTMLVLALVMLMLMFTRLLVHHNQRSSFSEFFFVNVYGGPSILLLFVLALAIVMMMF